MFTRNKFKIIESKRKITQKIIKMSTNKTSHNKYKKKLMDFSFNFITVFS